MRVVDSAGGAPGEPEPPARIAVAEVAGAVPRARPRADLRRCVGGAVGIVRHDLRSAHDDLAHLAGRERALLDAVVVRERSEHGAVRCGNDRDGTGARRAGDQACAGAHRGVIRRRHAGRVEQRDRFGLCAAVHREDACVRRDVVQCAGERRHHGRAARRDELQRRQRPVPAAQRGREVRQQRRRRDDACDVVLAHDVGERGCVGAARMAKIEARQQARRARGELRQQHDRHRAQRRRAVQVERARERNHLRARDAVRAYQCLRRAGAAARERQHRGVAVVTRLDRAARRARVVVQDVGRQR